MPTCEHPSPVASDPASDVTSGASAIALDRATQLDGDGGRYSTVLSEAWEIWGPNGGYLAALALRAAGSCAEIGQPASIYCQFLSSPAFARIELTVSHLKRSRRSEALAVRMTQRGKPILESLVRTAADAPGYEHQHARAPRVPPPDALKSTDELWTAEQRPPFRFWENVERRPIDQWLTPTSPANGRQAPVVREWVRFRPTGCFEDRFVEAARSLILLDTYGWPAAFRRHRDGRFIAPNLDTSAWFHQFDSRSEWLLIDHECQIAEHGLLGVLGRVWDLDGRLIASGSSQLCCLPAA
jgi:acyl-CoA thioesterase